MTDSVRPLSNDDVIVIFTDSADRDVSELSLELAARRVRVVRVNCDDDEPSIIRSVDASNQLTLRSSVVNPKVVWTRRFWRYVGEVLTDPDSVLAYDQLNAMRILTEELAVHQINGRMSIRTKWRQLGAARAAGFDTPLSVLTADLHDINTRLDTDKVVIKSLDDHWVRPGDETMYGAFPVVCRADDLADGHTGISSPLIVQNYLEIDVEVRVFVVGQSLVAYQSEARAMPGSIWLEDKPLRVEPYSISEETHCKILDFADRVGLEYGAIDLAYCHDGGLYFLECNDSRADWRYYEKRCRDLRVRHKLADYLEGLMDV